jgi:hypothetical protein
LYRPFADPEIAHPVQDRDHVGRQHEPFAAGQRADPAAVLGEVVDLSPQFGVDVADSRANSAGWACSTALMRASGTPAPASVLIRMRSTAACAL